MCQTIGRQHGTPLSSDARCNTPCRFDIGSVDQDLWEGCDASPFTSVGRGKRPNRRHERGRPLDLRHRRGARGPCSFAQHGLLHSMRAMATWFCDAYASWQKGGVENANGRLRRWLPRHIDIDRLSDAEIQDIVITANLTPRKCLGFKTPFQAILKELGKDAQI